MKAQNHDQCRKEMDQVNSQLNRAREEIKAISDNRQKFEQIYNQVNQELQDLKKMPSVSIILSILNDYLIYKIRFLRLIVNATNFGKLTKNGT